MLYAPPSGFYAQLLAKADFFDFNLKGGSGAVAYPVVAGIDGKSYGAEGEVGYRARMGGLAVDFGAGLAYVRTDIDSFSASNATFDLDAKILHEFKGDNESSFTSGGFVLPLQDYGRGTWGRAELGISGSAGGTNGFLAAWGELGDVKGYGLRAGIRF